MERVISSFSFLKDSTRWSGVVEVIEQTDESKQHHIYVQLKLGKHTVRLPRAGLREVIDALTKADQAASLAYKSVVDRMNPR
jgi:hypothetical protein